jgi:hypothetical protein
VAAHLAPHVTHLRLDLTDCDGFDGSGLRTCRRLVDLRLVGNSNDDDTAPPRPLVPDALAGCAARLASLALDGVDGGDGLFTGGGGGGGGLPALRRAVLRRAVLRRLPSLTDAAFARGATPALAELTVEFCQGFTGGAGFGPLPGLTALDVRRCDSFTGRALTAGRTPALRWLAVRGCRGFTGEDGGGGSSGSSSGGGDAQPSPQQPPAAAAAPALPALAGAHFDGTPQLTDAWFARTPALTHLVLHRCDAVVGGVAVMGGRLPALTHVTVALCRAFTGAWLGAAGGGASTSLESLAVKRCPALRLPDALAAPGRDTDFGALVFSSPFSFS